MRVVITGPGSWRMTGAPPKTAYCALCGRRIREGDTCWRVEYRASRGEYTQRLHIECGHTLKAWGENIEAFETPRTAQKFAEEIGCKGSKCKHFERCHINPFDCERCHTVLRMKGAQFGEDYNKRILKDGEGIEPGAAESGEGAAEHRTRGRDAGKRAAET